MPLPEKVIEQLGREPTAGTQGWATGALLFSFGILFLSLVIYFGLTFGYKPFLNGQLHAVKDKVSALDQSVSTQQQAQLIGFYSQIANLQGLLKNHVLASQLFTWLGENTEANVYYQSFSLTAGDRVTLSGFAKTEADINQQVAIFENSQQVSAVSVSQVAAPQLPGQPWSFSATLAMNPSVVAPSTQ